MEKEYIECLAAELAMMFIRESDHTYMRPKEFVRHFLETHKIIVNELMAAHHKRDD